MAMADGDLVQRVQSLEREKAELEREIARLRGEVDATRSALPEIEDLHAHLQRLREDYARRTDALQLLIAAAAREIGERTGVGPPPRPPAPAAPPPAAPAAPVAPSKAEPPVGSTEAPPPSVDEEQGPRPGADDETTDEIGPIDDEPAATPDTPPAVWTPDVSEPVRGDWTPDQRFQGRSQ